MEINPITNIPNYNKKDPFDLDIKIDPRKSTTEKVKQQFPTATCVNASTCFHCDISTSRSSCIANC